MIDELEPELFESGFPFETSFSEPTVSIFERSMRYFDFVLVMLVLTFGLCL